ncbi:hypothetical protein AB0L10_38075 [Streptomyces flaveolus]|uniref:hypothetical protein n=1 Tax=Streptomyces flaveolus TaxID=67297 RepID=UPI003414E26E
MGEVSPRGHAIHVTASDELLTPRSTISVVLAHATLDLRSVVWWLPRALVGRPAIGRDLFSGATRT